MIKIVVSFICGAAVCGVLVIGMGSILPAMADENPVSDNNSNFFSNLLPDFEKIYRHALTSPFINARDKIHDQDIADYYDDLMGKTGLNDPTRN